MSINWGLKTVEKKENINMNDFASLMPLHRSIFGTRITNALVNECLNTQEMYCNYTTFLITDENMQKIIYVHYDRIPGRNFGDLMDGLDGEMMQVVEQQMQNEDNPAETEEDPFPMFDENLPTGEE